MTQQDRNVDAGGEASPGDLFPAGERRGWIIAAGLTIALLPLAAMTVFAVYTARHLLNEHVLRATISDARSAALTVEQDFTEKLRALRLLTERQLLHVAARKRDRAAAERHLRQLVQAVPEFERAFIADPEAVLWADFPTVDTRVIGTRFSDREWYRGAITSRRPHLTGVYERKARPVKLVYAFAIPIIDERERLLGIVVAQDTGAHLQRDLGRIAAAAGGNAALFDHHGRAVFAAGVPLPAGHGAGAAKSCLNTALAGREGVDHVLYDDQRYVVVCSPIEKFRWAVVTQLPSDVVLAPVKKIGFQLGGAGLLLLAVAGAFAGYRANRYAQHRAALAAQDRHNREIDLLRGRYRALLDASTDGLALVDTQQIFLYANRAFGGFLDIENAVRRAGVSARDSLDTFTRQLKDSRRFRARLESLWRNADISDNFEAELIDGHAYHFYSHPVRTAEGVLLGRAIVVRDVSREKEADRIKSEFISTVSHELRTPLASLLGFSELMLKRELSLEKQRHFVNVIHQESIRLNALVNDFLDLQRIESGRVSYNFQALDASGVIREVAALFANYPRHPLKLELAADLPAVLADRDRLKQILNNLIANAVKFSPQGGVVTVGARAVPDGVEIAVSDRGLGIPTESIPKLFGKFYRVDATDRAEIGGTGLGLALCKEIVTAHEGRIWVESSVGKGSTFYFTLAAASAPVGVEAAPRASAPIVDNGAGFALIVEDDAAFATLVREHLAEEGFTARIEATAEAALAAVRKGSVTLLILDIHLAGKLDGWDFLIALKSDPQTAMIPVIVCSISDRRERGIALGASDYLVKPFPMTALTATVRRLLPEPRGARVIVADDDEVFRAAVAESLRAELGCVVRESCDGRDALAQIEREAPELVVLDLLMPMMDGFAVLDALRANRATAAIPVLVVTGKRISAQDKERLTHGMARVLSKEKYSREHLLTFARQLLRQRRAS